MSEYTFSKPYILNNWYIFPDSTLEDITINDCVNSSTGKCEKTNTLEQCLQLCQKDDNCTSGYFIETPDKENICVPIHNVSQDYESYVKLLHNIRNKNIFPILKNMKTYVFTNTEYTFPPDNLNNILYIDNVIIENIKTKKTIGLDQKDNLNIMLNEPVYVRLLPWDTGKNPLMVRNGDEIIIVIPNSTYVLRVADGSLNWTTSILSNNTDDSKLRIFSTDKNKKIGDFLSYKDKIYFTHEMNPIIYDKDTDSLVIQSMNIENAISSHRNLEFKISPKVVAYYCKEKKCIPIEIDTEKDVSLYRSPACWNLCEEKTRRKSKIFLYIIIVIILLILLKFFVFDKLIFMNGREFKQ